MNAWRFGISLWVFNSISHAWVGYWVEHENRPFATKDHIVQNLPCWRASSLLFPYLDIKTRRPEPVKLDLPLFWCPSAWVITSLPSSMADFVPCDRLLQKAYHMIYLLYEYPTKKKKSLIQVRTENGECIVIHSWQYLK